MFGQPICPTEHIYICNIASGFVVTERQSAKLQREQWVSVDHWCLYPDCFIVPAHWFKIPNCCSQPQSKFFNGKSRRWIGLESVAMFKPKEQAVCHPDGIMALAWPWPEGTWPFVSVWAVSAVSRRLGREAHNRLWRVNMPRCRSTMRRQKWQGLSRAKYRNPRKSLIREDG